MPATSPQPDRGPSSASPSRRRRGNPSSPTADGGYKLTGVTDPPDPDYHAFRQDLADAALAGRVIASHYVEPVLRRLAAAAPFRRAADDEAELIAELAAGDDYWLLDDTRGWAWGYAGPDGRVGYVRAEALGS